MLTFDPTTVGIGAVISIVGGIALILVRYFVDRPRNNVLRQDVDDLMKSRDEARKERDLMAARLVAAEAKATAATELATGRARVDELFKFVQDQVVAGSARQEAMVRDVHSLATSVEKSIDLRAETIDRMIEHERKCIDRHDQQMGLMKSMTDLLQGNATLLTRIADAFDVKNGG